MNDFVLFGSIANALMVVLGSLVGLLIMNFTKGKKNNPNSKQARVSDAIFKGLALCVILIGVGGAIKGTVNSQIITAFDGTDFTFSGLAVENTMVVIISMVLGAIIGELIDFDKRVNSLGDKIESGLKGRGGSVSQGFVSATLLFCVGSMSIVGAIESGITNDHTTQLTKGIMDMITSVIFASTMGIGVMFSAVFILLYQGSISLLAGVVGQYLSSDVIMTMNIVGSLLIVALGLNMLGVTKLKIMNYVPAMFMPILILPLWNLAAQGLGI